MSEAEVIVRVARVVRAGVEPLPLPQYETSRSAGLDLRAAIPSARDIAPGARELIPTGFAIELPGGYEGQVRPRSGLALRYGVTVLNAPGTIDSDYRGEVGVLLVNHGEATFVVRPGARIAQLVIGSVRRAVLACVERLDVTSRGAGGFGHTGEI